MSGTNLGSDLTSSSAVPLFIPPSSSAPCELPDSSSHHLLIASPVDQHGPAPHAPSGEIAAPRVNLFGVAIDALRMKDAILRIQDWLQTPGRCRYVVTPNVDHVVMLQRHAELRAAYADADLVLADGWPVVLAARLLRRGVPERVPGSDLVPALCAAAGLGRPLRLYLLGAAPGVAQRAAINIHCRWPGVSVVGTYSPPLGFERDAEECERILSRIAEAAPHVLVVGLGAPKQELWVHQHRERIAADAALCVGATIDFLAGEKRRAPRWLQRIGLEWCHRMLSEPRRLLGRYARDAWIFPQIVWSEWRGKAY